MARCNQLAEGYILQSVRKRGRLPAVDPLVATMAAFTAAFADWAGCATMGRPEY
jgi:hypothetical protein